MNIIKPLAMTGAAIMIAGAASSCSSTQGQDSNIIDRPDYKSTNGIFDIEALEALGRVSSPSLSRRHQTAVRSLL